MHVICMCNYCLKLIKVTPSQKPLSAIFYCKQAVFIKSNKRRKRLLHNYYKRSKLPRTRSSGDRTACDVPFLRYRRMRRIPNTNHQLLVKGSQNSQIEVVE